MRKFINSFTWAFLLVFSVPSVLIVVSWNSLPGEALYTIKLGLEQSLLFVVSPSVQAKESLQVHYTERRLSDAKRMLNEKHSVDGLPYLTYQIKATKDTLVNAPKGETQKQLAQKYITTLENASSELEQQKLSMTIVTQTTTEPGQTVTPPTAASKSAPTPTTKRQSGPTPTQAPVASPTVAVSVTVTNQISTTTAATALQISKTQQTIKETIDDLKKITEENDHGSKNEQKNNEENKKSDDEKKGKD